MLAFRLARRRNLSRGGARRGLVHQNFSDRPATGNLHHTCCDSAPKEVRQSNSLGKQALSLVSTYVKHIKDELVGIDAATSAVLIEKYTIPALPDAPQVCEFRLHAIDFTF